MAQELIRFAFFGEPQDYDLFVNWWWGDKEGEGESADSDSELSSEFAVRVHHLRRSFSFDTALLSDPDDEPLFDDGSLSEEMQSDSVVRNMQSASLV